MDNLNKAKTLADDLNDLRASATDVELQLSRHIRQRDLAIADLTILASACADNYAGMDLRHIIDERARSITTLRKMLADLEVKEGRLRRAANDLLGQLAEEPQTNICHYGSGGFIGGPQFGRDVIEFALKTREKLGLR